MTSAPDTRRLCAVLLCLLAALRSDAPAKPLFETQEIFASVPPFPEPQTPPPNPAVKPIPIESYWYHVPGIVVTKRGVVLAYAEWRNSVSDWGDVHLNLRRSRDGGVTWEPEHQIAHFGEPLEALVRTAPPKKPGQEEAVTVANGTAIPDRQTGAVHFLYQADYRRCFYMHSEDDGATFSRAVDITAAFDAFRPEFDWKVLAPGPGHGIQLENGRLVVPVWLSTGGSTGWQHAPSATAVIYSDDHGQTWHRGDIVSRGSPPGTDKAAAFNDPNETTSVQLANGDVLFNLRAPSERHRRLQAVSRDGVSHWSAPAFVEDLFEPLCFGSLARCSKVPQDRKNRLLFINPQGREASPGGGIRRADITVFASYDEGATWPVHKIIAPGPADPGYSDLAVLPDKTILAAYARSHSSKGGGGSVGIARFNLEWLTDGKDDGEPAPRH